MKSVWSASQSRRLLGALVAVGLAVLFTAGLTAGLNTSSANSHGRYDPTHGNNEEQGVMNTTQVKESNDDMWTFNTVGIPNTGSNGLPLFHPSVTTGSEEQGNEGTLKREVKTSHYNQSTVANTTTVTLYNQSTVANTTTVSLYNLLTVAETTTTILKRIESEVNKTRTSPHNWATDDTTATTLPHSPSTDDNTATTSPPSRSTDDNTATTSPHSRSNVYSSARISPHSGSTVDNTTITVAPYSQSTGADPVRYSVQPKRSAISGPAAGDSQTGHQPGVTTRANVQHSNPGTVGTETRADLVTPAQPTTLSPHFCTTNETDNAYIADTVRHFTNTDFLKCDVLTHNEKCKCSNKYCIATKAVSMYEKDALLEFTRYSQHLDLDRLRQQRPILI